SLDRAAETVQSLNPLAADRMQAHVPAASRQAAAAAQSAAQQSLADGTPASESMSTAAERLEQLADGAEAAAQEIADAKGLDELALEVMANLTAGDLRDHIEAHFQETFADEVAPRAANAVADQAETMMERLDIAVDDALAAELRRRVIEALLGHVPEAMETPAGELANEQARSDHDLDEAASSEGADDARQRAAAAMMSRASQAAERVMGQQMQAAANRASLGDVSEINQAVQPGEAFASTMDQLAAAMREGRGNGGSLAGMMGLMAMADGQGSGATPAGPSNPFAERLGNVGGSRDMAALRRMMEMIDRRDDPDALYDEVVREAEAMVSRPATPWPSQRSATILLAPHSAESPPADEPDESQRARVVPEPSFEPINYGAAPMAHQPVRVDGELDDWDLDRALVMHVVKGEEIDSEQGLPFHVMWSNEAFYITMDIPNEQVEIPEGRRTFWVGDCIEVWIDTSNRRGPQMYTPAHQIFFLPWATQDNPELRTGESRASSNDNRYALAVKDIPAGYRVEMAIPHEALRGPRLEAGRHIGFQIAVNHSHGGDGIEWVQRGNSSFNTPAMWGDLLLLGSDAEISFSRDEKGDKSLDAIVPGEPVYVRVSDPDMSLSAEYPDQLTVIARQSDGAAMLLVLGETAPTSGVFVGGLDTRSIFAGGDEDENVLAVAPGEPIIVGYLDQRRDYGESNEQITAELKVGFPRMRIVRD
ncbi:MAG: sugar-binding protein, partial [Phycisphaeraceae bacterium]